jgi:hypothetical protein
MKQTLGLALIAFAALLLAGCGGSDPVVQHAQALLGGSLSNFGGAAGADLDARAVAREMATGRSYDFMPSGFTVAAGAVTSTAPSGSDFGDGAGTLTVNGDDAEVVLNPAGGAGGVTGAKLEGSFSLAAAQAAVDSPGRSFVVTWTVSWTDGTDSFELTAEQSLTGTDFSAQ